MKKMLSLLMAVFLGVTGAFADFPAENRPEMLDYIAKLKAQEYVRELVRLKIDLIGSLPDSKNQGTIAARKRVDAINRELLALVTLPLEIRKKELEKISEEQRKISSDQTPIMRNLKDEIARLEGEIVRAKAELIDSMETK